MKGRVHGGFTAGAQNAGMSFAHPFARIVVAYDGTPPAEAALEHAIALAAVNGGEVVLAHVSDLSATAVLPLETRAQRKAWPADPVERGLDAFRRPLVEHVRAAVAQSAVPVTMDFSTNGIVAGVLDAAERWEATAIAIGVRDLPPAVRTFTGSTTEGILRAAHVPVLIVREGSPVRATGMHRVVVGLDDSAPSLGAAVFATSVALERDARLIMCSVVETASFGEIAGVSAYDADDVARRRSAAAEALEIGVQCANAVGVHPDTHVIEARRAASGLLEAARRQSADCIVVGTHGRGHIERMLVGSTAETVVRHSEIPVVVVPPEAKMLAGAV